MAVPPGGRVLDLGCGHGLLTLVLASDPHRTVEAVDVSDAKVAVASRAISRAGAEGRARARVVPEGWRPPPSTYDCVVVADVLYLLGRDEAVALVGAAAGSLVDGGVLVVKEMAARPRWKLLVNQVQENLAVRVGGITQGRTIEVLTVDEVVTAMAAAGLATETRRLDRRRPHPHAMAIGRRDDATRRDVSGRPPEAPAPAP